MVRMAPRFAPVAVLLAVVAMIAAPARGSVKVAGNAPAPRLCVMSDGRAEVSWSGSRVATVALNGGVVWGHPHCSRNVGQPESSMQIPMAVVVLRAPDGTYHALQQWQRLAGGPVELRYSRWDGEPTKLVLRADAVPRGAEERVRGVLTFHGKPVHGFRSTSAGVPLDPFGRNVYLDAYRAGGWQRMMGILAHKGSGAFSLWIRPQWEGSSYRGRVIGPNLGSTLAPDAEAICRTDRR